MTEQNAEVKYAGFWLRVVAAIIDSIIFGLIFIPINIFMMKSSLESMNEAMMAGGEPVGASGSFLFMQIISIVLPWLYYALTESSAWQATVGKKVLGLEVTDIDGDRISFLRATGRYWAKLLSSLILCIGFLMAGFTKRKQGLHDMIAGTLVVKNS